jgi:oligopeptide transport system substrate-binding protein
MIVGAEEIADGKASPDTLGVRAVDDKTLIVELKNNCPWFLETMAFPPTAPVRGDLIDKFGAQWATNPKTLIGNGPYKVSEWTPQEHIVLVKNPNHYDYKNLGPKSITFKFLEDENAALNAFTAGELDYNELIPLTERARLREEGLLTECPALSTEYIIFNTQKPPFNDVRVRRAFSLAINRAHIVKNITHSGYPAGGFIPFGMPDVEPGSDFRKVGGDYISVDESDYEGNCVTARELFAEAGYPGGRGFPQVEAGHNTSSSHKDRLEVVQHCLNTELGVKITLVNEEWSTFIQSRREGKYLLARGGWSADDRFAHNYLAQFMTGNKNNDAFFSNEDFDNAMRRAGNSPDIATAMRFWHEAEEIFMRYAPVAPVSFGVHTFQVRPDIRGIFSDALKNTCFSYAHCE